MSAPAPLRFSQELTTGWQVTGRRAAVRGSAPARGAAGAPGPRSGGAPAVAPARRPRPVRGLPTAPGPAGPVPVRPAGRPRAAGAAAPRTGAPVGRAPVAADPRVVGLRRLLVALVVAAGVGGAVLAGAGADGAAAVPERTAVVRVGAGETVWDVARRVAPGSEPAAVVDRIRELNGLAGSAVTAGQPLRVPDGR